MPDKKIRATRRRRSDESDSEERRRASAPSRGDRETTQEPSSAQAQRPASQEYTTRPTTSQTGGAAPQIPIQGLLNLFRGLKLPPLVLIGILALVVICGCILISTFLSSGGGGGLLPALATQSGGLSQPTLAVSTSAPAATRTPRPFTPPAAVTGDGQTWLVMLYQDADDKVLEQDIYLDLNEAERVGSGDQVHIVSQVDRYQAGFRGDGDWSSTKRFYVTLDNDLGRVTSQEIADLGELNMADGDTLVDFATWAIDTFPADKHVLILSDHGLGWPGGWSDPSPGGRGGDNIALADMGDQLFLMELDDALQEIRDRTGLEAFELVGMDACLMGHLEVFTMLAPHARYAVASQETEPALGWAYTGFLSTLEAYPNMDGAELGRLIVESYIQEDQRIVDDQARAELLSRGSPLGAFGLPSAEQVAQQMEGGITLSAIDLSGIPALNGRLNELAYALQGASQSHVARARSYAQSFTSIFGQQVPPSYLDLGHFVQLLESESGSQEVETSAGAVLAALDEAVIAERHGRKKPGATGLSIYFPNSQVFQSRYAGPESYTTVARQFASESLWDEFLTYHYTGKPFELTTGAISVPDRGATIEGPGTGKIQVSAVSLSSGVAAPGQPVLLSTDISGENIGHVLLLVGFYDQNANSIFIADNDYLEAAETREIDGVYYPDWGSGDFTMEFEWEPIVFAIHDGVDTVVALFKPEVYGATFEEAVYTVDGIYTYADDGETRYAQLRFSDGELRQVFGFTGDDGTGAPREITPSIGDTFTVLDTWWDLDDRGNVAEKVALEGGTLTFGEETFTWEELDAAPGVYIVGFVVQDLDGNAYETLDVVTV
ncbi:MAG: clostripain-related cysteine peptidase, partial [Anaerolineae bacterium]